MGDVLCEVCGEAHQKLFLDELPLVSNGTELIKVKQCFSHLDESYMTSACCQRRRDIFEKLWCSFWPYADNHFLDQVKRKGQFHQRTWEMYVGYTLLQKNISFCSRNEGPDFVITNRGHNKIYIECVACTPGMPDNVNSVPTPVGGSVPENQRDSLSAVSAKIGEYYDRQPTPEEKNNFQEEFMKCFGWQPVPEDPIKLRITQAFEGKIEQYKRWSKKNWFSDKSPYVITINIGGLGYLEDPEMPYVPSVMLGLKREYTLCGRKDVPQDSIRKKGNTTSDQEIDVAYFLRPEFACISGILFSNETVLNHMSFKKTITFLNNPHAQNEVKKSFSESFDRWEVSLENGKLGYKYIPFQL